MMFPYPFFSPPFEPFRRPYYARKAAPVSSTPDIQEETSPIVMEHSNNKKELEEKRGSSSHEVFELFGITLHFDDILLICLLFFLYSQGVQDEWLFISLIMLLLT